MIWCLLKVIILLLWVAPCLQYFSFTLQLYVIVSAGTPYAGGVFRMKLVLGKSFPSDPPKGFFLTKIFHPNVAKNGEICVNTLKKDWKPMLGIKHVLLVSWDLILNPYDLGGFQNNLHPCGLYESSLSIRRVEADFPFLDWGDLKITVCSPSTRQSY